MEKNVKGKQARNRSFAGIRNTIPPERFGAAAREEQRSTIDLVEALNVDIDDSGQISLRNGQTTRVAGSAHSIWAEGDVCLFVQSGAIKQLNKDWTATQLGSGLSDAPMRYLMVAGRVYHTNGTQKGVWERGFVRGWGIRVLDTQPTAIQVQGQLPAGTYLYALTRLSDDGRESGTGLASRIDLLSDGSGIQFSWEPQSMRTAIYVTTQNGEVMYRAAILPAGASAYHFAGGGIIGPPLRTQFYDAPPAGRDLTHCNGRIFIAVDDKIFATLPMGYEYCDLRDYKAIDGTTVRFIVGVTNGLFIGTEQKCYYLKLGATLKDSELVEVVDGFGVAGSALTIDGSALGKETAHGREHALFATELGIYLGLPDGTAVNLTHDRYRFTPPSSAAAAFRSTPQLMQYVLTTT